MARSSLTARLARTTDTIFLRTVLAAPSGSAFEPASKLRELRGIADETRTRIAELGEAPLFPRGRARDVAVRATGRRRGAEVLDLVWTSEPPVLFPSSAAAYTHLVHNRRGHARLIRRGRGRPVVVLVHGYLMGALDAEERVAWPIGELLDRGFDVAMVVLPGHGPRNDPGRLRPAWPAREPRFVIDGFRQAMFDLTTLTAYLRAEGATSVGAIGMSLGGYSTALLATVDDGLDFAMPLIPIASFADHMRDNGHLSGTAAERASLYEAFDVVHAVVDPLRREVLVPPEGRIVVAGREDQVTPPAHAERIASHFGVPVTYFPGAHLLQLGRDRAVLGALDGLVARGVVRLKR